MPTLSVLNKDGYKVSHPAQYPDNTERVHSNWTARGSRIPRITHTVHFGSQHFCMKWLIEDYRVNFFNLPKEVAVKRYKRRMDGYLGKDAVSTDKIEALHDLGFLPLRIKSLPEGSLVPMRVPSMTIINTEGYNDFYWLTNDIETLMSCEMWGATTSATIAREYRRILNYWCELTGGDMNFVQFQGHDFSMRGMYGVEAAKLSGMGHLLSFVGTDTIPAIDSLEDYYGANSDNELVGCSVPATEHAVMCAGSQEGELSTFERLLTKVYPTNIVSVVSDTWDLWAVLTVILPQLKTVIMQRDGKLVIRPDSGDPVDILCGLQPSAYQVIDGITYRSSDVVELESAGLESFPPQYMITPGAVPCDNEVKGVIELLWELFGGKVNDKGFKVLDSHIGAIYGDSITLERADEICRRLANKGFCSTNVVLGIGSYTYQYNTRDTFGFAMKATWCQIDGQPREIFKNPKTDNGLKKSAKGLVRVDLVNGEYVLVDQCTPEQERGGCLEIIFENGKMVKTTTLGEIRGRVAEGL